MGKFLNEYFDSYLKIGNLKNISYYFFVNLTTNPLKNYVKKQKKIYNN